LKIGVKLMAEMLPNAQHSEGVSHPPIEPFGGIGYNERHGHPPYKPSVSIQAPHGLFVDRRDKRWLSFGRR